MLEQQSSLLSMAVHSAKNKNSIKIYFIIFPERLGQWYYTFKFALSLVMNLYNHVTKLRNSQQH